MLRMTTLLTTIVLGCVIPPTTPRAHELSVKEGVSKPLAQKHTRHIVSREGRIKSAALYYISKFVTWPEVENPDLGKKMNFCVLGDDPLNDHIEDTLLGKTTSEQEIQVSIDPGSLSSCDLLFLGELPAEVYHSSIDAVRGQGTLTIQSQNDSTASMISLSEKENKLQIEVNLKTAKDAGFYISSELLMVSHVNRER